MATATAAVRAVLLNGETLISFPLMARQLPGQRGAEHAHVSALSKWRKHGIKAESGEVVRLEAVRIGARWYTSAEAVARFSAALGTPTAPPPAAQTGAPSHDEAVERLKAIGA